MVHPPAPESVDPESLAFPSALCWEPMLWETPAQSPRFNLQQGTFQPGEPLPATPAQECDAITGLARGKGL